jgi:hypothetical protein
MSGANTPSWRGAQLKRKQWDKFTFNLPCATYTQGTLQLIIAVWGTFWTWLCGLSVHISDKRWPYGT